MQESTTDGRTLVLRTAKESPAAVRVAARDFGAGIDEADLGHIFQAFYTTKSAGTRRGPGSDGGLLTDGVRLSRTGFEPDVRAGGRSVWRRRRWQATQRAAAAVNRA
jgi:hypothetical protein